jgi:hypothetical protein
LDAGDRRKETVFLIEPTRGRNRFSQGKIDAPGVDLTLAQIAKNRPNGHQSQVS